MSDELGTLDERGLTRRAAPRRVSSLRGAATIVGAVFLGARATRTLPFDSSALPHSRSPFSLYPALSEAFTYRLKRENEGLDQWHEEYRSAALMFIRSVRERASQDLQAAREQTDQKLTELERELRDRAVTERLAAAARQACDASGVEKAIEAELQVHTRQTIETGQPVEPLDLGAPRFKAMLAPEVAKSSEPLLRVLFLHPDGLLIIRAYAKAGLVGQAMALQKVDAARQVASAAFGAMLESPHRVWRYVPILNHSIHGLRVDDVDGVHGYAKQIGLAITKEPLDDVIAFAQMTLAGIALAFAGPELAAVTAAFEVADLGLSLWDLRRRYIRERENELLSEANPFGVKVGGPAVLTNVPVDFSGVAINGALTLLAGVALYRYVSVASKGAKLDLANYQAAPAGAEVHGRSMSIYQEALGVQSVRPGGVDARGLPRTPRPDASPTVSAPSAGSAAPSAVERGLEPVATTSAQADELTESWLQPIGVRSDEYAANGLAVPEYARSTRAIGFGRRDRPSPLLSREFGPTYAQFSPGINPHVRFRSFARFVPRPGEVAKFGPRAFYWDADRNLVRATTTDITLGIRDKVQYENVAGLRPGVVYGHLLGIQFGTIDAEVGAFGGFLQAQTLNQWTKTGVAPRWLIAENRAFATAWNLKSNGRPFLVVAEARDFAEGAPAWMRLRVFEHSAAGPSEAFNSQWLPNPLPPPP